MLDIKRGRDKREKGGRSKRGEKINQRGGRRKIKEGERLKKRR